MQLKRNWKRLAEMSKQDKIFSQLKDLKLEPLVQTIAEPVTILEAAKSLNVSQGTVRNYIRQGRLDKVTIGRKVFVPLVSIERFAQSKKQLSSPQKSSPAQSVDEPIALSTGSAVVEVSYLEGLLTHLGQLKTENRYLLECQADQEKGILELAGAKARIVELQTKESEAQSRVDILEKENKYIRSILWIVVGVGLSLAIVTMSLLIK
jgi:excisionase family DNA binding protein